MTGRLIAMPALEWPSDPAGAKTALEEEPLGATFDSRRTVTMYSSLRARASAGVLIPLDAQAASSAERSYPDTKWRHEFLHLWN